MGEETRKKRNKIESKETQINDRNDKEGET